MDSVSDRKVTVLIPTLNEIEGMRAILPQIKEAWYHQLLVIDGGSTDGTARFAEESGCEVMHQTSKGVRGAYLEALPRITGDIVIPFSPDGNCIPEAIPKLAEKMMEGDYDMVIASRYADGASSEDDDLITGFGNWTFTRLINFFFGSQYTDAMGMYRAWKKDLIKRLEMDSEEAYRPEEWIGVRGVGLDPLLAIRCAKRKLKVAEIPAGEPKRIGGERKLMPFRWGLVVLLEMLREIFHWR